MLLCVSDPKEEGETIYKLISLSKEIAGFKFSQKYDFEIDLSPESAGVVAKYNQMIIYLAVVTKSEYKEVIRYSKSYSKISD